MTEIEIANIFSIEKGKFEEFFKVSDITLCVHDLEYTPGCSGYRDIAWADPKDRTVNICFRALEFHRDNIIALIRHEIGHLCDPFYLTKNAEQRADDIAYLVTGQRINYSGPYLIQTIAKGEHPRPKIIHG
jgi:hypothetical protein